jgi:hypothetical protein
MDLLTGDIVIVRTTATGPNVRRFCDFEFFYMTQHHIIVDPLRHSFDRETSRTLLLHDHHPFKHPTQSRIMSDLAPFVASVLRDMVVDELQEEIRQLRARLSAATESSRTVSISGVNGEIIAEGHLDNNGRLREDSTDYWQVDLMPGTTQCSSMEQFRAIEIRIGDLRKSVLEPNSEHDEYGYFNHYDPDYSEAEISFGFGGGSIFGTIGPLSQEDFDALPREYDQAEIFDVFADLFSREGGATVTLVFETIQFANNLYTGWNVRPLVVSQEN